MINSFRGRYAFLSNFTVAPVVLDNAEYPSVEHAFQAAKTLNEKEREKIRKAPSAGTAKKLGRSVTLRKDWNILRIEVMKDLLRQKFVKYDDFRSALMATGSEELQEGNYWNDRFWGTVDGQGENHLGKLLMRIREELRNQ